MTKGTNYYVIVGREGTRPVTRWLPAWVRPETNGDRRQQPAPNRWKHLQSRKGAPTSMN